MPRAFSLHFPGGWTNLLPYEQSNTATVWPLINRFAPFSNNPPIRGELSFVLKIPGLLSKDSSDVLFWERDPRWGAPLVAMGIAVYGP